MALFQNKRRTDALTQSDAPLRSIGKEQIAAYSDLELYDLFLTEQYAELDKDTRLAALQEVENRRAKIDGRKPIRVISGEQGRFIHDEGLFGCYTNSLKTIEINFRFLTGSSFKYSGAAVLTTLLHEGRHAAQYDLMDNRSDRLSLQTMLEWRSRKVDGFTEGVPPVQWRDVLFQLYQLRPLEMDARRFARRQLGVIAKLYADQHRPVPESLNRQIKSTVDTEVRLIQNVKNKFSMKLLDEIDRITVDKLKKLYPDLNLEKLRLFDHARIVINTPLDKIENYEEIISKMDRLADEHMDRAMDQLERLDRTAPERLRENQFLL